MKKIIMLSLFLLISINVSAMSIDYYYHPECAYCQEINPFMQSVVSKYSNVQWNLIDTSQGSYNIDGTPTLIIDTSDNRKIQLIGSYEITKYLECEINDQSNLNCPTYSALESRDVSWFIRE